MQYILTQEEFDALQARALAKQIVIDRLQTACTLVADHMPIKAPWAPASTDPKPWGCILSQTSPTKDEWYCDHCPVRNICPQPNKNWSK